MLRKLKIGVSIRDSRTGHKWFASGAGMSRVKYHLEHSDFLIITNYQADQSSEENYRDFHKVPLMFQSFLQTPNIGGIWLVGHWMECRFPGKRTLQEKERAEDCVALGGTLVDAVEQSWMLIKPKSVSNDVWLDAACHFASEPVFNQNAFIICLEGKTTLRGKAGEIWDTLDTVSAIEKAMKNLTWLRSNMTAYGYSELHKLKVQNRDHKIVFTPKQGSCQIAPPAITFDVVIPGNIADHVMFQKKGYLNLE